MQLFKETFPEFILLELFGFLFLFSSIGCSSLSSSDKTKIIEKLTNPCTPIKGIPIKAGEKETIKFSGAEDITIDVAEYSGGKKKRVAFISVDNRREEHTLDSKLGGIFIYTLGESSKPHLMDIVPSDGLTSEYFTKNFSPHGLSLYKDRLFVINHRIVCKPCERKSRVEIFRIDREKELLIHIRTVLDENTNIGDKLNLNDLVATGPESFYTTDNYLDFWGKAKSLKTLFGLAGQNRVIYYDGKNYNRTPIDFLTFANGINISPDKKFLYVSSSANKKLRVFKFKGGDSDKPQTLEEIQSVNMKSGLDNIEWVDTNKKALLIGSHASISRFFLYSISEKLVHHSPSEVFMVPVNDEGSIYANKIEKIFYNLGDTFSGASVAAGTPSSFLVGSVFNDKILSCSK